MKPNQKLKLKDKFKNDKHKAGFTLIELLVVVSIISLMSSIMLVAFRNANLKARNSRWLADVSQLQKAYELYYDDHSTYPNADSHIPVDALRPYASTIATAATQYEGSYFALSPSGVAIADNGSACVMLHKGYFIAIGAAAPNKDTLNDGGIEPAYYERIGGDFKIFNSGVPGTYTTTCPDY